MEFIPDSLAEPLGCDDAMHCRYGTETKTLGKHLNSSAGGSPPTSLTYAVPSFFGRISFFSFAPRLSQSSQIVRKMWHQKWAYGSHFCGGPETRFNGIGGPKLGTPKTQSVQLGTL